MDFLFNKMSEFEIYGWELWIGDWFFVIAMGLFLIELIVIAAKKQMSWNLLGDSLTNFVTLTAFRAINIVIGALFYLGAFFYVYEHFSITQLPITWWSVIGGVVLADIVYYWEHRFMHMTGIGWATHTVHHSSPYFNLSVAYRFGPLDGLYPLFFHLPLVMLGFHPFVVFLAEMLVQTYQTLLHTETIGKLPRPVEAVMNTPSHHRVHHATNRKYLDKNYAGIFIIWDKMFGTFAEEDEKVRYGVFPRINSVNPFKVFFEGIGKLSVRLWHAPSWGYRLKLLVKSPTWAWEQEQKRKAD
ncbi:MAG: sterol desaturase family protein [Psychrobium sp.]